MARPVSMLSAAVALLLVACAAAVAEQPSGIIHRVCKLSGTVLYVIQVDPNNLAEGTSLKRYQTSSGNPVLIDSTKYAALHQPSPAGSMWGDGVGYASTMQTRNMWMYSGGTSEAFWNHNTNTGADTWTFRSSSAGGGTTETVLRTSDCPQSLDVVPPPPTTSAPVQFRLCGRFGDVLYEAREDQTDIPTGTTLKRYNMSTGAAVFMDTNSYAALALPSPRDSMWGDGVAFASTMQTRFAWMYPDPTLEAYWDTVTIAVESAGFDAILVGKTMNVRINDVIVKNTVRDGQHRGFNVVVLDPNSLSTVVDSKRFGVSVAQHDAFAAYIGGLATGTPVVVGVMDDAWQNLNEAAKLAAESIGSASIRNLQYRSAWAIIGRKGAAIGSRPESMNHVTKFTRSELRVDTWRFHGHGAESALVQLAALRTDECPNNLIASVLTPV